MTSFLSLITDAANHLVMVDDVSLKVTLGHVEITRSHLEPSLFVSNVPTNTPWWAQLEYNARNGIVFPTLWNESLQNFVLEAGVMKREGNTWYWEKTKDSEV